MESKTKSRRAILWNKAFKKRQNWENKDDLLDVVYWMRQIMSLFLGLVWGLIPLTGVVGMLLYFLITCGIVYFYCTLYQGVDEEELGGIWELLKEGFMTSFAIFILVVSLCTEAGKEWGLVELQGVLETHEGHSYDGLHIGDLHFSDSGTPSLIIGHHLLTGKVVSLDQPLAVMKKSGISSMEYNIVAFVTKKIVFSNRPKPLVSIKH